MQIAEPHTTPLIPLADAEDVLTRAFPASATCEAAHELVGEAITALVDVGYSLDAARAILLAGLATLITTFEC